MKTLKFTITCFLLLAFALNAGAITPVCSTISSYCYNCIYDPITGNPKCTACLGGRYPSADRNSCLSCSSAINSCSACVVAEEKTRCLTCASGKYPSRDGLSCLTCGSAFPGCTTCYYLTPGRVGCQSCSSGFPSKNFQCSSCSTAINNCNSCKSDSSTFYFTVCTQCSNGLYPSILGDQCVSCQQNIEDCLTCQISNGQTVCTQCCSGKFLSGNHKKCLSCGQVINKCLSCKIQSGTLDTLCQSCGVRNNRDLFPSMNQQNCRRCEIIIQNCQQCQNTHGNTFCKMCKIGYFLQNQSKLACKPCSDININCNQCVTDYQNINLGGLCINCIDGYFVSTTRDSCLQCTSISGCAVCQSLPNGGGACKQCQAGFFLQNNVCSPCTSPCSQCEGIVNGANIVQSCIACETGLYLDSNLACQVCGTAITNCQACSANSNLPGTICDTCSNTFYPTLNNLSCQDCSFFGCDTCTIQNGVTVCLTCPANEFTSACKLNCDTCANIIPSCLQCAANQLVATCINCDEALGQYISPDGLCRSCQSLIPGCQTCDDSSGATLCTLCNSGLFVSTDGLSCNLCGLTNCQTCLTSTMCSQCIAGYYVDSGTCKPCGADCILCQKVGTGSICTKCLPGLTAASDGSCKPCNVIIPSCTQCSGATPANPTVTCTSQSVPQIVNGCYYNCLTCNPAQPYKCLSCDMVRFYLYYDYCHPLRFPISPTRT